MLLVFRNHCNCGHVLYAAVPQGEFEARGLVLRCPCCLRMAFQRPEAGWDKVTLLLYSDFGWSSEGTKNPPAFQLFKLF